MRPDGERFVTGDSAGSLTIWDFATGRVLSTFDLKTPERLPTTFLAYNPAGDSVVAGDEGGVLRVWDLEAGSVVLTCPGPARPVRSVAFVGRRVRVASGAFFTRRDPIVIWETPELKR